jgi:asparagine synthase (glutamine-hydrolysing)
MCGLAGLLDFSGDLGDAELSALGARMASPIVHRGPDDSGVWTDARAGVALAFRRLSILDLSPLGHQPMTSPDGRYTIAFNGEIYNFAQLREELLAKGYTFRGRSDTEVLLAATAEWGVERACTRLNGMFAFALWDSREQAISFARDRFGEKPLYIGTAGNALVFGSELKALRVHPAFDHTISRGATALFLRHSYIPSPLSIYESTFKLPAATCLTVSRREPLPVGWPALARKVRAYWSLRDVAARGVRASQPMTMSEAADALAPELQRAVAMRMVADVPVGAFLSGGLDSSLVTALMQSASTQPVRTFTIGFHEAGFDEAAHARKVAEHLGTHHTELYFTPTEVMSVIPRMPALYDEPFADSSQLPTFLVAQLARRDVTVTLSGDGGDEIFGGYSRYFHAMRLRRIATALPSPLRRSIGSFARRVPNRVVRRAYYAFEPAIPMGLRVRHPDDKLKRLSALLGDPSMRAVYRDLMSNWKAPEDVVEAGKEPVTFLSDPREWLSLDTSIHEMMYADAMTYLPDDILVKVDRATMAVSLEGRAPLLDPQLVEFAWQLPANVKFNSTSGKHVLREVLIRHVPAALVDRPKMGFGVPLAAWLRGPLQGWADDLLSDSELKRSHLLCAAPVRDAWERHKRAEEDFSTLLWPILMLQSWTTSTARQTIVATSSTPEVRAQ